MRYSVRFPVLLRCCDELEKTARQHIREIDGLRQTRRNLSRLSGMEAVVARIDRELTEMEEQRRVLLSMAQAVRRAHQIYTDAEKAVMDEADCPCRPLTELRFDGGGAGGGGTDSRIVWSVRPVETVLVGQGRSLEVTKLDVRPYATLMASMDVTLKAAP